MSFTAPKGVFDVLPSEPNAKNAWRESHYWHHLESVIREMTALYGYKEIRTPIFERTELFARGVGEGSDIVSKEMYSFVDKGDRSMTLRPEGTASVMRAVVEHNLCQQSTEQKFYYTGPMFRYERPQAGRYRQHQQFGIEAIGYAAPEQDVEIIDLILTLYKKLGLKNLTVQINTLGDTESRTRYREALKEHLKPHLAELSEDSQRRFSLNPLRILDSKSPKDREIVADAPSILDYLSQESESYFAQICSLLDAIDVSYEVTPRLVRGLDYYTGMVFEVLSSELGAQNTIGAGGRYDGLMKTLGGADLPSVGFATGLERVLQTMHAQNVSFPSPEGIDLYFIPLGEAAKQRVFTLVSQLRHQGVKASMDYSGRKLNKVMRVADQYGARHVAVIGEEELSKEAANIKNMKTGTSEWIPFAQIHKIQNNK